MKKANKNRSRRPLAQDDYRVLAEFRYVLRHFLLFSEQAAQKAGLTPQQHQALLVIKGAGGEIAVGALAERLAIHHHSAVGLVNRLVGARLVRRMSDGADKRRVLLALTPLAEDLLEILTVAHRDELRKLSPSLSRLFSHMSGS